MKLFDLAHCRAGDKGDTSILAVVTYRDSDYPSLVTALDVESVSQHFGARPEDVAIVLSPKLHAITISLRNQLGGGVTRSLRVDPHGKSLSSVLLELEMPFSDFQQVLS